MKKLFGFSVLALALTLACQQEASAWTNIRFGIGANMAWQTGNNSALWGLWRDGQIPGAPTDVNRRGGKQGGFAPYGMPYGAPGFADNGAGPGPGAGPMGAGVNGLTDNGPGGFGGQAPVAEPPPAPAKNGDNAEQVGYFYNGGRRPTTYSRPTYRPSYGYTVPQSYYYYYGN